MKGCQAMKSVIWLITGACFLCISAERFAVSAPPGGQRAPECWTTPGTQWLVQVRKYSIAWAIGYGDRKLKEKAQEPRIESEFHMRITILEPRVEHERTLARIEFRPLEDAPNPYAQSVIVLEIDASNGKPLALKEAVGKLLGGGEIEGDGGEGTFFSDTGFPTSWIASVADLARVPEEPEDRSITLQSRVSLDATVPVQLSKKLRPTVIENGHRPALEVEAASGVRQPDAVPYYRVVQTWVPGEGFWRSYKGYIQNHINIEATLVEQKEPPPK